MKSVIITTIAMSFAIAAFAEDKPAQFKDQKDKFSYAIGLNIGMNFKRSNIDTNPEMITAGIKDAIANKPLMTTDQVKDTMVAFEKDMQQKQADAAKKNEADSEKFLAANKSKEGVKTTASGLQYKVIKEGNGAQPKATDTVTVNYRGTLIDGTEFDSSYKRNQPATFPVSGVIKGWTEGLQLMKMGAKYQFFIPASLAYGDHAPTPQIPPGSTLIFEVELMSATPGNQFAPTEPGSSPATSPK